MSNVIDIFTRKKLEIVAVNDLEIALDAYLDDLAFRDYDVLNISRYGKVAQQGIHVKIDSLDDMKHQVEDAIETFFRDGYSNIFFYIGA